MSFDKAISDLASYYTKAALDNKYDLINNVYDKAASDNKYALISGVYDKAASYYE